MVTDLEFAKGFATYAGGRIVDLRRTTARRRKLDRTDVTDADISINNDFINAVQKRGDSASVLGEERSRKASDNRKWIIDPIDGTGEYVNDNIADHLRTTCVGISLMLGSRLTLSVVLNPFRRELFTATHDGPTLLNGKPIRCSEARARRGVPYDYSHWNGARFDLRFLEKALGPPLNTYSAIYQACEVAMGRSAFAAFPGNTIHDIAPAALLVARAGGRATDFVGRPLDWTNLNHGVLYANAPSHGGVLNALRSVVTVG